MSAELINRNLHNVGVGRDRIDDEFPIPPRPQRGPIHLENILVDIEDRENNNTRRRSNERIPQFQRRRNQHGNDPDPAEGGDGDGEERMIQLANLEDLNGDVDEEGNTTEVRLLKHVFNYFSVMTAKWTVPVMLGGWLLLFLPSRENKYGLRFDVYRHGIPLALALTSITGVAVRKDIEFFPPFQTFEMRIIQMIAIIMINWMVNFMLEVLGPGLTLFHFDMRRQNKFMEQVELAQQTGFTNFLSLSTWCAINTQFFMVGFAWLLLVDNVCTFCRIYRHSRVIAAILKYEFWAYLKPYSFLCGSIILLNEISAGMDPTKQSVLMWQSLFILLFAFIGYIGYCIWKYPEIPLRRPIGVRGYLYMEWATIFQCSVALTVHMSLCLARGAYFQTVPGAMLDSIRQPGLILGPSLFLDQLSKGTPSEEWTRKRLFEPTFDTFHGLLFCILIIRYLKLKLYSGTVRERIEQLLVQHFQHAPNNNNNAH